MAPIVKEAQALDHRLVVGLDQPDEDNPAIVRHLLERGAEMQFVGELRHSLEDVYLRWLNDKA